MITKLLSVGVLATLFGCASIARGTTELVTIQSVPSGAAVTTDIGLSCPVTPCQLKVPRNKAFTATAKLGNQTGTVKVDTVATNEGNNAMVGNVVVGGLIGAAVDSGNGANKDHKPNPATIYLK
ncbi:translation initiation factor 2 [Rhizobium sp. 18055]|uniref:translation initiation factor 2 n=1 Tax=Rhizobium sp. 18055 TaxID=2681403 RepID=UPI00135B6F93|nr:translation initiation factor 2 [Rhizobium sp. 18055]